jgi:CRP/FNR family transcriptional regulator, nitrogen fixation regulation protein
MKEGAELMYRQLSNPGPRAAVMLPPESASVTRAGQLDVLVALERIGTRLVFSRNQEIYAEGDRAGCWYKVISGTVRICKLLGDGRRYIAQFCFSGDAFGLDNSEERSFSAEAVGDVIVMRFSRTSTEQLIGQNPSIARMLHETMLRDLADAHGRMLLLGRMTAVERVATFILEMHERRDCPRMIDLPMPRNDIADYLGLTIETVCRVLSALKRERAIGIPNAHCIELCDRAAIEALAET